MNGNTTNDTARLLIDHYDKTYDLTYKFWKQRNSTFLILVGVVGIATLLTYRPADTNSLLVDLVASALGISTDNRISELRNSFPFALLQGILLTVIFYLMVNLFHRSLYILRNYAYLGALEDEIRAELKLEGKAFTRESDFYWHRRPFLLSTVKVVYVILLGGLIIAFLVGRVVGDLEAESNFLVAIVCLVGIPTLIYFGGYAWYTLSLDTKDAIAGT